MILGNSFQDTFRTSKQRGRPFLRVVHFFLNPYGRCLVEEGSGAAWSTLKCRHVRMLAIWALLMRVISHSS
jgi:hypothetical protein